MKRLLLPLCLLTGSVTVNASAQNTATDSFFLQGKALYEIKNWDGCLDMLSEYKKQANDADLIQEADFMIAASAFEKERPESVELLEKFIATYPASRHIHQARFLIGSSYFISQRYQDALDQLSYVDMNGLKADQQPMYMHRMGVSNVKIGRMKVAEPYFVALKSVNPEYSSAASYYLAYIKYSNKEYDEALRMFKSLPLNNEYSNDVPYYIAQIQFINNDYASALESSKSLIGKSYNKDKKAEIVRIAGESAYNLGQKNEAIGYLKQYVELSGKPLRSTAYILGIAAFEKGDYATAAKNFARVTSTDDATAQSAYLYMGQSYVKMNDVKNACLAFEAASKSKHNNQVRESAMYNYALAVCESSYSPFNESLTAFEQFLTEYPGSQYTESVQNQLADVYMTTRNYDAALTSINKITAPNYKVKTAKQRILFQLGAQKFANAEINSAWDCFNQAIGMGAVNNETLAQAYFWRGECLYNQGEYGKSATDFRSYLATTSNRKGDIYALGHYNLGYSYFKLNDFNNAVANFEKYISMRDEMPKSTYIDALNRLADSYFYQRNFVQAEKYYNRSAELSPANADYAVFQKGFMAGLQKRYDAKIQAMDQLLVKYPDSEYADDALMEKAKTYMIKNNQESALATYKELSAKYPNTTAGRQACLQMGIIYFNSSRLDQSIEAYKSVISSFPGSEEASIAAEDLKAVYIEKNDIGTYAAYIKSLGGNVAFDASEQDSLTYLAAEKVLAKRNSQESKDALNRYIAGFENGAFRFNANAELARIYLSENNSDKALEHYGNIIAAPVNRFSEEALQKSAEIYYGKDQMKRALEMYQSLLTVTEKSDVKRTARLGVVRAANSLDYFDQVITASTELLKDSKLGPDVRSEVLHNRSYSYIELGKEDLAIKDLTELSADTRNAYGAEAKYRLAQIYFNKGNDAKSESLIMQLIDSSTPHQYWMARGFILLSDIYIGRNELSQARLYLQSLKNNYKGDDDIAGLIKARFNKIGEGE